MENLTELLKDAPTLKQARETLKGKSLKEFEYDPYDYDDYKIIESKNDYDLVELTFIYDIGILKTKIIKDSFKAVHPRESKIFYILQDEIDEVSSKKQEKKEKEKATAISPEEEETDEGLKTGIYKKIKLAEKLYDHDPNKLKETIVDMIKK